MLNCTACFLIGSGCDPQALSQALLLPPPWCSQAVVVLSSQRRPHPSVHLPSGFCQHRTRLIQKLVTPVCVYLPKSGRSSIFQSRPKKRRMSEGHSCFSFISWAVEEARSCFVSWVGGRLDSATRPGAAGPCLGSFFCWVPQVPFSL
jgi:hypothetical protein